MLFSTPKFALTGALTVMSCLGCLAILTNAHAEAVPYIEISGGKVTGIPLAILPFKLTYNQDLAQEEDELIATAHAIVKDLTYQVTADLRYSGQFKLLETDSLLNFYSGAADNLDFAYWRKLGADNILSGELSLDDADHYTLLLRLVESFNINGTNREILKVKLTGRISEVTPRRLAHRISDMVFSKLLGVPGVFSTKLAYITVDRSSYNLITDKNETKQMPGRKSAVKIVKTQYALQIADFDGYGPQKLVTSNYPLMSPAWSPDGKKLAFVSFYRNRPAINVLDIATGKLQELIKVAGINGAPAWHPNGRSLAVVLSKDGAPNIYLLDLKAEFYLAKAANSQADILHLQGQLSVNQGNYTNLRALTQGIAIATEPNWSQDGKTLYFTSNQAGNPQIYKLELSSGITQKTTFIGKYNTTASVTPDNNQLICLHQGSEDWNASRNFAIAVFNLKKPTDYSLLTKRNLLEKPTLAPNGLAVAYTFINSKGESVAEVRALKGNNKVYTLPLPSNVKDLAWSPYF